MGFLPDDTIANLLRATETLSTLGIFRLAAQVSIREFAVRSIRDSLRKKERA
jgi:hypothetical protein